LRLVARAPGAGSAADRGNATGDPGSRGIPLSYARDLAPARCRSARRKLYAFGGTLLNVQLDIGMSPPVEPPASPGVPGCRRSSRRRGQHEAGVQGAVPEEAVHREGRCAPTGEAPDRGIPAAVRRGRATKPAGMQRSSNAGILREWPPGGRCADVRVHRTSSDEASGPPPRTRSRSLPSVQGRLRRSRRRRGCERSFSGRKSEHRRAGSSHVERRSEDPLRGSGAG